MKKCGAEKRKKQKRRMEKRFNISAKHIEESVMKTNVVRVNLIGPSDNCTIEVFLPDGYEQKER